MLDSEALAQYESYCRPPFNLEKVKAILTDHPELISYPVIDYDVKPALFRAIESLSSEKLAEFIEFLEEQKIDYQSVVKGNQSWITALLERQAAQPVVLLKKLQAKGRINLLALNAEGKTPLCELIDNHYDEKRQVAAIHLYETLGLRANAVKLRDNTGLTLFLTACKAGRFNTADVLLKNGSVVNEVDYDANNVMHLLCDSYILSYEKQAFINNLLSSLSPIEMSLLLFKENKKGDSAFSIACKRNLTSVVDSMLAALTTCDIGSVNVASLIKGILKDIHFTKNWHGFAELMKILAKRVDAKVLKEAIEKAVVDDEQNNLLHILFKECPSENQDEVIKCISPIVDVVGLLNTPNNKGLSPTYHFMQRDLWSDKPSININPQALQRLIDLGFDASQIISSSREKRTLLHYACICGDIGLAKVLLANKVNVNTLDNNCMTALDYTDRVNRMDTGRDAAENERHTIDVELKAMLLAAGATQLRSTVTEAKSLQEIKAALLKEKENQKAAIPALSEQTQAKMEKMKKVIDEVAAKQVVKQYTLLNKEAVARKKAEMGTEHYLFEENPSVNNYSPITVYHDLTDEKKLQKEQINKLINEYDSACDVLINMINEYDPRRQTAYTESDYNPAPNDPTIHVIDIPGVDSELYPRRFMCKNLSEEQKAALKQCASEVEEKCRQLIQAKADFEKDLPQDKKEQHVVLWRDVKDFEATKGDFLKWPEQNGMQYIVTTYSKVDANDRERLNAELKQVQHLTARKRLGWELMQRNSSAKGVDDYLKNFTKKPFKVGNTEIELYDLTKADDYRFIVNTVLTRPERLNELAKGEPVFFDKTPFLSACVLDKITRAFAGGHQANDLFPLYLALEVPPAAIAYMGPTDIGSPYACLAGRKLNYLQKVEPLRANMDAQEAAYQQEAFNATGTMPSPFAVQQSVETDKQFSSQGYKESGSVPFYSVETLMQKTNIPSLDANAYCELIITGNVLNPGSEKLKGHLLIVDKHFLDVFNESFNGGVFSRSRESAEASLKVLKDLEKNSGGRIKLAIVDTDTLGYKSKLPIHKQIDLLEQDKERALDRLKRAELKRGRLKEAGLCNETVDKEYDAANEDYQKYVVLQQAVIDLAQGKAKKAKPVVFSKKKQESQVPETPVPSQAKPIKPSNK